MCVKKFFRLFLQFFVSYNLHFALFVSDYSLYRTIGCYCVLRRGNCCSYRIIFVCRNNLSRRTFLINFYFKNLFWWRHFFHWFYDYNRVCTESTCTVLRRMGSKIVVYARWILFHSYSACPRSWQVLHLIGFGMYSRTFY